MYTDFSERDKAALRHNCGDIFMSALNNPDIIEIMLNPDGKLWIERYGQEQEPLGLISREQATLIISMVASSLNVPVSYKSPIVEGEFPLDGSRFEGIFPPIVSPGPAFSLRKKASKVFSLRDYVVAGTMREEVIEIIRAAVADRKNILVVGGTSSGKTTFVNAVIEEISKITPDDRLLILEDTAELQSKSKNCVFMRTSNIPGAEVNLRALAKVCMRCAPKRIIIGEVRDLAALELLKLWNAGHPGGVGTFHADSAEEALPRLEELVEEAGFGSKHSLIGRAVDLIVYMEKNRRNQRQLSSIIQVNSYDKRSGQYDTEVVYAARL